MIKNIYANTVSFSEITGTGFYQTQGGTPGTTLETFFSYLLGFFTVVGGVTFLVYFLIGAFSWITSEGDREKLQKAQRYMSNGIIGLIVVVLAWGLTGIIGQLIGFDILDLATNIGLLDPTP